MHRTASNLFLSLVLALASMVAAGAHPVHATFAEAVWNPKTRSLECAMRVRGIDLEAALSKGRDKRVDLDKTAGVDALIGAYLKKHLRLTLPEGHRVTLQWSDKEVGITNTWLYFAFPVGKDTIPTGAKLENTVFFDALDGQRNVVEYRDGKEKQILAFEGAAREITIAGSGKP